MTDCHHAFDPLTFCCTICGITLKQAAMDRLCDKPEEKDMPCPECNDTGVYRGLNTVEPCKACLGLSVVETTPEIAKCDKGHG